MLPTGIAFRGNWRKKTHRIPRIGERDWNRGGGGKGLMSKERLRQGRYMRGDSSWVKRIRGGHRKGGIDHHFCPPRQKKGNSLRRREYVGGGVEGPLLRLEIG